MRATIGLALLTAVFGWCPTAGAQTPPAGAINRAVLRQPSFVIPFHVDPLVESPIEVQLFVSRDGGRTWQLAGRELPAVGRFTFQAPEDGPYWFTSRTIGRDGRQPDMRALRPELLVHVDRRQPEVDLQLTSPGPRQIHAEFTVVDALLDLQTLQLEYRMGPDAPWEPVGVNVPPNAENQTRFTGRAEWSVPAAAAVVDVRLAVRDQAGNLTAVNRRLALTPPRDGLAGSSTAQPIGTASAGTPAVTLDRDGAQVWHPNNRPRPQQTPRSTRYAVETPPAPRHSTPPLPSHVSAGQARRGLSEDIPHDPLAQQTPDVRSTPFQPVATSQASAAPPNANPPANPASDTSQYPGASPYPLAHSGSGDSASAPPVEELPLPESPSRAASTALDGTSPSDANYEVPQPPATDGPELPVPDASANARQGRGAPLPSSEQPVFTKQRRFQLDYDVEAVGVRNVAETQLWVTTDGGRNWKLWGKDPDRRSPFDVEVDSDGVYGFRMIVVGDNGLATPAPQPGDTADIWVAVDTAPPVLQFTGARYGTDHHSGKLVIQWQARDAYLPSSPVSIEYAASPQGPWMAVATDLPNSGEFAWRPGAGMPRQVYLRIRVRDEAGNVATAIHPSPIDLAGLAPRARIRGVIPRQ